MKVTPVSDYLVVKPVTAEETSASGIIIPDTINKERPERGEVISIGPGRKDKDGSMITCPAQVGQVVLFKKYAPDEVKVDGAEYLLIRFEDIMAIVE